MLLFPSRNLEEPMSGQSNGHDMFFFFWPSPGAALDCRCSLVQLHLVASPGSGMGAGDVPKHGVICLCDSIHMYLQPSLTR